MRNKKALILISFTIMIITFLSAFSYSNGKDNNDVIYKGISINDIEVSGLTKQEAYDKIDEYINGVKMQEIKLVFQGKSKEITYEELGFNPINRDIVEEAYGIGRVGNIIARYKAIKDIQAEPVNLTLKFEYNKDNLVAIVDAFDKEVSIQPKNATIKKIDGFFVINKEQQGIAIDTVATADLIGKYLDQNLVGKELQVVSKILPAAYTEEYYTAIQNQLSSFHTSFTSSSAARSENIRVASSKINGSVVHPGEVFSTAKTIAPITAAAGYKEAGVYVQGKIDTGIGGGVCQLSTTLYNTVLFAELEIVERHNHSMTVSYVEKGRDAAIAGDVKDFKFKNNTGHPIYIESYVKDKQLFINIYGLEQRNANRKVNFETVLISTIQPPPEKITKDDTLPVGTRIVNQAAMTGYKVKVYKLIYEDNKLINKELLNSSNYIAAPAYITIGTKPVKETFNPANSSDETIDQPTQESTTGNGI